MLLILAVGWGSGAIATAQQTDKNCEGNPLAAVLPPPKDMNGYKWHHRFCGQGLASEMFMSGESSVDITIMDSTGTVGGKNDGSELAKGAAQQIGQPGLEGVKAVLEMTRSTVELAKANPQYVQSLGGPNYVSLILLVGGKDNYYIGVPAKRDANGDFISQGVVRDRYVIAINVKKALAGMDGPAARATIEPFLKSMSLNKLP